jgi:hypothetical protein
MKTTFVLTLVILLTTTAAFCQTDSIIYFKKADFTIYKLLYVKYEFTGEVKLEKHLVSVEDANTLYFLGKDSLAIANSVQPRVYTRLADIDEVSKYKNRHSIVGGALLGAAGGAIFGAILGYAIESNDAKENEPFGLGKLDEELGAVTGAIIGALCGGIIGITITNVVNTEVLDLFSVPEKEKKEKLIRLLRRNK